MTRYYTGQPDTFAQLNDQPNFNLVINPRFEVWQRAASYALTTSFAFGGPDRWMARQPTSAQCTISQAAPSPALAGYRNALKVLLTGPSSGQIAINTAFESVECLPFQGQSVTLSFWCLKGSSWNPASLLLALYASTGADQATANVGAWSGQTTPVNTSCSPTTSWVKYEFTATVPSNATQLGIQFAAQPSGAAVDANSYLMITGIRLESGSKSSDFDAYDFPSDFSRCQRHLPVFRNDANSTYGMGSGHATSTTAGVYFVPFATRARIAPTGITVSAASHFSGTTSVGGATAATGASFSGGQCGGGVVTLTGMSGLTAGNGSLILTTNVSALLLFTGAEL